ncbi:MAG: fibronectin type III domain-containing protein [Bacteroidales bacterium]|nr:fibronectin type III domain-containing protein [Bacteroidales bacterium]
MYLNKYKISDTITRVKQEGSKMKGIAKRAATIFLALAVIFTFTPFVGDVTDGAAGVQEVYAAEDTAPPEIDPNSVTIDILGTDRIIAESGDTVRISMTITDESVITGHYLYLYKPQTGNLSTIVSGVQLEGTDTWNFDFEVTDATEMGIWKIYSIRVEDSIGNYAWYYNEELHSTPNPQLIERFTDLSLADFEVSGTHPDLDKPEIDLTTLTAKPANAVPGDNVKISVKVTDASAIKSVNLWIEQPNGNVLSWQAMTYNAETGKYERTIAITDDTVNGQWQAIEIIAEDELGNSRTVAAEYGYDFSGSVFTVSGAGGETNAPAIDDTSVRVRLPAGSAYPNSTQVAYAKVTDDTIVQEVTFCYVVSETGSKKYFVAEYDEATDEWQARVFVGKNEVLGAWKLLSVTARDRYYNTTTIYNSEISDEPNAKDLSDADFEVIASIADAVMAPLEDVIYTGAAFTPEPEVMMTIEGVETPLIKGKDYRFAYYDNTNAGTATVSALGEGTYGGWLHGHFTIKPRDLKDVTFPSIPSVTYNGQKQEPTFTPVYNGMDLVEGIDYTVGYKDNISAGTATVTITGIGNYTGTRTMTFKINKKPITPKITLSKSYYFYSSSYDRKPTVTVYNGTKKVASSNYTVKWPSDVRSAGKKTITVTMKGNYSGSAKATYTIFKPTVKLSKTAYTYTGKSQKPTVSVYNGSTKIGTANYNVIWPTNTTSVGKKSVKVKMKGKYYGEKTVTYKINPSATSISGVTAGTKQFTVKWAKRGTAQSSGYEVQYWKSGDKANAKTVKATGNTTVSKTVKSLQSGKTYYVRIRVYKTVGGVKYVSAWTASKSIKVK